MPVVKGYERVRVVLGSSVWYLGSSVFNSFTEVFGFSYISVKNLVSFGQLRFGILVNSVSLVPNLVKFYFN